MCFERDLRQREHAARDPGPLLQPLAAAGWRLGNERSLVSRSTTQRVTNALRRFTGRRERARQTRPVEHCELCATPLHAAHDHLLDPYARGVFCACSACAVLFPDVASSTAKRYVRVRSRVARLPSATLSEHDMVALGAPVRLAVLCPSSLHDALFMLYPSAGGPVEARGSLKTWRAMAAQRPELEAVQHDRDAVIADLRVPARPPLHVTLDVAYELLGTLRAATRSPAFGNAPDRFAAFETRLAALQRTGGSHG
jgi:hypothetical protein